jgi:hypothetical protein
MTRDENGVFQIRCRGFESDGSVRLAEQTVNTDEQGQQRRAVIAMEANGRFVVAWADRPNRGKAAQIFVRGFENDSKERFRSQDVSSIPGRRDRPGIAAPAMSAGDVFNPVLTPGRAEGAGARLVYPRRALPHRGENT